MINILLSVKWPWSDLIMEGRKKWELRKNAPRVGSGEHVTLWLYESGKDGERAIIGKCGLFTTFRLYPGFWGPEEVIKNACVSEKHLRNYQPCYIWAVNKPVRLPHAVPLSVIGLTRPPQSWQYITTEQAEQIERIAKK